MIFLYASTTLVYFVFLILAVIAVSVALLSNEGYIFLISMGIIAIAIFGIVITSKLAARKYNKSLSKLEYDIHSYLNEQYKFLNKMFISKSVRETVKTNIACGFIYNEQCDEALRIFDEFSAIGYQGLSPKDRFLIFMNQAYCNIKLNKLDMAMPYIQNSEIILRTARFPADISYELSLIFQYITARYNYQTNPNSQTAQDLINKINARLNYNRSKSKSNFLVLHYELGVLYMRIGDTARADGEFYYILRTGSSIPCVNRIKVYNKTGNISVLEI